MFTHEEDENYAHAFKLKLFPFPSSGETVFLGDFNGKFVRSFSWSDVESWDAEERVQHQNPTDR